VPVWVGAKVEIRGQSTIQRGTQPVLASPAFPLSVAFRLCCQFHPGRRHFPPLVPVASPSGYAPIQCQIPSSLAAWHRPLLAPVGYPPRGFTRGPHRVEDLVAPEHAGDNCSIGSHTGGGPFQHGRGSIQCIGYMRSNIHLGSQSHS
jgi:hypothetical protein